MSTLHYSIKFYSYWHTDSGLSQGMEADNSVLKDKKDLPYLPGKTIKGLLRDAALTIQKPFSVDDEVITAIFGSLARQSNTTSRSTDDIDKFSKPGTCRFNDALLNEKDAKYILDGELTTLLYRRVTSTKLDENRQAEDKSLRTSEATTPLILYGSINNIPEDEEYMSFIRNCLKAVKHIGLKRSRGWGRCLFTEVQQENKDHAEV